MKECLLDCDLQHEGYCSEEITSCKAKSNNDLMTEEDYENSGKQPK